MTPVAAVQLGPLVVGPAYRLQDPSRLPAPLRQRLWHVCNAGTLLLRHHIGRGGEPLPVPQGLTAPWRGEPLMVPVEESDYRTALGLVLDGALAIDAPGGPLAGPTAAMALGLAVPDGYSDSLPMELSCAALRLASQAPVCDLDRLTATLYYFGRTPLTPDLRHRAPDAKAVFRRLGLDRVDREAAVAQRFEPAALSSGWFFWRSGEIDRIGAGWKLYVCTQVEALTERLPRLAAALADTGAQAFKITAAAHGLCRPDRMVAYFGDEDAMRAAAAVLLPLLHDCPAEPLPFSEPFEREGRLSFGRDPARGSPDWLEGQSWRLWLCGRLARALAAAAAQPDAACPPWRFALLRAATLGLDPATFGPSRRRDNEH